MEGKGVNRRLFLQSAAAVTSAAVLPLDRGYAGSLKADGSQVMTVRGPLDSREMGLALTHEHLFADLRPHAEQVRNPVQTDVDEVVEVVLPYLRRLRELGCRTFVDATAVGLGRDPALIKRLSEESGLHMLTVTGNYAAADYQFLPMYVYDDSAERLAQRWIGEWDRGIRDSGVRPGFIKLSVNDRPLSDIERKLIRAAAMAHLETGLTIGTHTRLGTSAFAQLSELETHGVHPSAWMWIHAHHEQDLARQIEAARRGAWISFDGINPDSINAHVELVKRLRDEGQLRRVLVSQDAGWYRAGEPRGGNIRAYDTILTKFAPALRSAGFTSEEIDTLFIENPAQAFSVRVRKI
jgi:predicted metal-dependent phosphotriesterase family hydrolase